MGLTIEQLVRAKTKEDYKLELLRAMQGVGYVRKTGPGEGSLTVDGPATDNASVVIQITGDGALGVATFQYSVDAGGSFNGVDIVVPSLGEYALPVGGATLTFASGPGDADLSFIVDDTYSFELAVPTLPTTNWAAGSTPLTIIETDAAANEDFGLAQQSLAKSGFLLTAENSWLDLVAEQVYDTRRIQGQVAIHTVLLTDAGGGGPHSIAAGQLVATTASGLRFSNTAAGTLLQNDELELPFQAERKGTTYNVGVGAINALVTVLPGVQVTNADLGGGTSLVQQGVNRETDPELRERCELRWGALGVGATEDAYEYWAKEASNDVTHVRVKSDPDVGGGVIVIVAGPSGPVSGGAVDDVTDAIEPRLVFGSSLSVVSATAQAIAVTGTVYVKAGLSSVALAQINANLTALFQGGKNSKLETLPGFNISDGTLEVYRAEIIEQIQVATGVRNVDLSTLLPAGDTAITEDKKPVLSPAPSFTFVEVG